MPAHLRCTYNFTLHLSTGIVAATGRRQSFRGLTATLESICAVQGPCGSAAHLWKIYRGQGKQGGRFALAMVELIGWVYGDEACSLNARTYGGTCNQKQRQ